MVNFQALTLPSTALVQIASLKDVSDCGRWPLFCWLLGSESRFSLNYEPVTTDGNYVCFRNSNLSERVKYNLVSSLVCEPNLVSSRFSSIHSVSLWLPDLTEPERLIYFFIHSEQITYCYINSEQKVKTIHFHNIMSIWEFVYFLSNTACPFLEDPKEEEAALLYRESHM